MRKELFKREAHLVSFDVLAEVEDHFHIRKIWEIDKTTPQAVWRILPIVFLEVPICAGIVSAFLPSWLLPGSIPNLKCTLSTVEQISVFSHQISTRH